MDPIRFAQTVENGRSMLTALFASAALGIDTGGKTAFYNAYYHGQEVVVLGFVPDESPEIMKAIAILVDGPVFDALRVDDESSRYDSDGQRQPKQVM